MAHDQKHRVGIEDRLADKRQEIRILADQYGAYNVRVFGSVARGEAGPDSDIDFLVSVREGVSMFDLVGLWLDLKDLLGCEISLIGDEIEDQAFLQHITQDAVPL